MTGIGSGPIQEEFRERMGDIAQILDEIFNLPGQEKRVGFILMTFEFGTPTGEHRCNYISNANREDVMVLLREQLAYFAGQSDELKGTA